MELKTEGFVLKRYRKGESDDITVIFTRELGKILTVSKSTRKLKSKLKFALELFSLNGYSFVKKKRGSKYFTLVSAVPIKMFENMRVSLRNIGFSYLVVELLNKFLELEDKHEDLFDLTKEVMNVVDEGNYSNVENVESYFKLKLLKITGFSLAGDSSFMKKRKISDETTGIIRAVEMSEDASKLDVEYEDIREVNKVIDSYIVHVLGEEVVSTKFMQRVDNGK